MTVEGKDYVQDLKNKDWLQDTVVKEKIGDNFDFAKFDKEMEQYFNQFLENHKNEFTKDAKKETLQRAFNNWLDTELIKLDTFKDKEIEKAIIGPTTFELQKFNTATELWIFESKVNEEKDKTKKTEKITITWDDLKIDLFKDSSWEVVDKDDIVKLFTENNFKNKDDLLNLLKSWGVDNVKEFQRIIAEQQAGQNDDDLKGYNKPLWKYWVDGKFGWKTMETFKEYVIKHKIETTQSEQANEAIVTENSGNAPDPAASNLKNNDWQGTYKATAEFTAIQTPDQAKWTPQEKNIENTEKQTNKVYPDESDIQNLNDALSEVWGDDYNVELKITTGADGNKMDLFIPKELRNKITILYDNGLKDYITTGYNFENVECFKVPANINVVLKQGKNLVLELWNQWSTKLDGNSNLNWDPWEYDESTKRKFTQLKGSFNMVWNNYEESSVTSNENSLNGQTENEEGEAWEKTDNESKNEYHNLEDNKYGEVPAEVVDSNYDALIDYMKWKDNKNLKQAFNRLKINPNSIANTLAQILEENSDVSKWSFRRTHISANAMKQLWRNEKRFINEKNNLVKILNNVEKDKLQQFINEMKVFNDIRELQKTKKFVEMNKEKIKKNPFLVLSDFGKDWTLDTWEKWLKHNWRTSEQAMYDVFVSLADTKVFTEKGLNGQSYKTIVDWPKTEDLVKGFISLIQTVWDDRYDGIEEYFWWYYTMNKLWEFIGDNAETLVLYQQTINSLSYNSSMDIQDLVSDSRRKSIVDREIQDIKEISTNRDEINNRFESQLWKNEEFNEWFQSLSAQEQKNFVWNMAVYLDKWWLLQTIVKIFWINSETWVTVDSLNAVDIDFNLFKDDAWIWPRIALVGLLKGKNSEDKTSLGFHLDIPIVNLTANFDLNHKAVENSVIHGANPVHQLYTRLWANVWWWIVVGWKTDEKLSAYFSGAIEWALWWKADYKKWVELSARNFGNVLQNGIFKDPDFSSKGWFKGKAEKSIEDIVDSTDKENKNLRKFFKNNKQAMLNCINNVSNLLDVMWAFGPDKKPEHKKILLNSIMKWIVEEVKNQNLWELDGKTKLTRLWVFGQAWVGFDAKKLFQWDFKWAFGAGWSVWLESTVSAWNMIYLPDKEKYEYMDAQLKSWASIKPLGEGIKTNNIENMEKAIAQSLSENSIPDIKVKWNEKSQIEISVTNTVLEKYGKKNIYELFNIYVNPEKKNNVAISEDGKTLTMGGNNLENFSVATRRYFNDFAIYLMIWWKWIDGCGNNKINVEQIV